MKKLLYIVLAIIVTFVVAVMIAIAMVDTEQLKKMIVEQVKTHTGRELVIDGELGIRIFPAVGFTLENTQLKQPGGFDGDMVSVKRVNINIEVLPLLDKQINIDEVELIEPHLAMIFLADGRSSLEGLVQEHGSSTETEPQPDSDESTQTPSDTTEPQPAMQFAVNGIKIQGAQLILDDRRTGQYTQISDLQLLVSDFTLEQFFPVSFSASLDQQPLSARIELDTELKLSPKIANIELKSLLLSLTAALKDKAGTTRVEPLTLTIPHFAFAQLSPVELAMDAVTPDLKAKLNFATQLTVADDLSAVQLNAMQTKLMVTGDTIPGKQKVVTVAGELVYQLLEQKLRIEPLQLGVDSFKLDGFAQVIHSEIPQVRFNLASKLLDLNALLPQLAEPETATAAEQPTATETTSTATAKSSSAQPDLSVLRSVDIKGTLDIDKLLVKKLSVADIKTQLSVGNGLATLDKLSANLYEGSINTRAQLNGQQPMPTFSLNSKINNVQALPLLKDAADLSLIGGAAHIDADLKGKGLDPDSIKRFTNGLINVKFLDGAVYGMNIPQKIRGYKAKLTGEKAEAAKAEQKTDFSALTASFHLANGEINTDDLLLVSPLLRVTGKGKADIVNETVDFMLATGIVGTLEGQGGRSRDELTGVTIPLSIKGSWTEPKFALDFDALYKAEAKKVVDQQLNKAKQKADKLIDKEKAKVEAKAQQELDNALADDKLKQEVTDKLKGIKLKF